MHAIGQHQALLHGGRGVAARMACFLVLSVALHLAVVAVWPAPSLHISGTPAALHVALREQPAAGTHPPAPTPATAAGERKPAPAPAARSEAQESPVRHRHRAHHRHAAAKRTAERPPPQKTGPRPATASDTPTPGAREKRPQTARQPHSDSGRSDDHTSADKGPEPPRNNPQAAATRPPAPRRVPQAGSGAAPRPLAAVAGHLKSALFRRLHAHFQYPLIARMRGWQGLVKVGVRVEADGTLSHLRVIETSGYSILDDNSLRTVRAIARVPRAAGWLRGHHVDLVLPVSYRLTHGG